MAINERVRKQREITIDAWGSERYAEEEKKCWDIIEEEALKDMGGKQIYGGMFFRRIEEVQ